MTTRRKFLMTLGAGAAFAASPRYALAQDKWPQRPVKILVPFAAGGGTDGVARLIAQHFQEKFGQGFVVENRVGGSGIVAAENVAKADPDGYTLMIAALPQIAILPVMRKPNYDPIADFTPISNIASNPFCLVANPQFEPKTLKEFVAYVKERPGKVVYASGGSGSLSHLTMVLLLQKAGLDMIHVPYKGGGPAIADVIGNQAPVYFGNLPEALPHAGGTLRLLAVSGAKRSPKLPDVPTAVESGYPEVISETWNGLIAPAKTPPDIISRMAAEVKVALKDEKVLRSFDSFGVTAIGSTPEEFKATMVQDIARWKPVVEAADLK